MPLSLNHEAIYVVGISTVPQYVEHSLALQLLQRCCSPVGCLQHPCPLLLLLLTQALPPLALQWASGKAISLGSLGGPDTLHSR
jgi:hypothetical protein